MNESTAQRDFATLQRLFPDLDGMEGDVSIAIAPAGSQDIAWHSVFTEIGARLEVEELGRLEKISAEVTSDTVWAIFDTRESQPALEQITSLLSQSCLIQHTRILFAEPATGACSCYWPPEPKPQLASLPFFQMLQPSWFAHAQKLGLQFVLVAFDASLGSPIYAHPEIEKALGSELGERNLGMYDSSLFKDGTQYHLFHVSNLAEALSLLKQQLANRNLLRVTRILHRDTDASWLCYYSFSAPEIAQTLEDGQ